MRALRSNAFNMRVLRRDTSASCAAPVDVGIGIVRLEEDDVVIGSEKSRVVNEIEAGRVKRCE